MSQLSQLMQLYRDEKAKWGNSPKLMDLLMRDRSTQGIRDYAGNVQQRGATLAGLLQGREPTDAQKALFSGLDPTTDEGAMNFALTFAGPMAKTANLAKLKVAERMKAQGVPDEKIHANTGWFFGMADGKPRFEIADNRANVTRDSGTVGDAVDHAELLKAYPEMGGTPFQYWKYTSPAKAEYSAERGIIGQGPNGLDGAKSTTLHELQHAIQQREGWARGGSPDMFGQTSLTFNSIDEARAALNSLPEEKRFSAKIVNDWITGKSKLLIPGADDPFKQYKHLAGEAEARLTQSRMNMTPEQRAASYPPSMFDVPVEQQIVRGLLEDTGKAMSKKSKK